MRYPVDVRNYLSYLHLHPNFLTTEKRSQFSEENIEHST